MSGKKIIHSFISKVLTAFLGALVIVFTSRWLGAEVRGQISLLLSWLGLWGLISEFVSGSTIINLCANYKIQKIAKNALIWTFGIALTSGLFHLISQSFNEYFWIIALIVFLTGAFNIFGGILIGSGKINQRNYVFVSLNLVTLLVLAFLTLQKGIENVGLREYVLSYFCGWLVALLLILSFSIKVFKNSNQQGLNPNFKMMILNGSLSQTGHLLGYAIARLPFFMMEFFYDFSALGIFSVAVILGETILIISSSLGQILHAKVIHLQDKQTGIVATIKYTQVAFLLTLPALAIALLIPSGFWVWLLKKDFETLGTFLLLFSPAIIFQSISSVLSHFYHAANLFKVLIKAHVIGLAMSVLGILTLQYFWGINGFILGATLGYASVLLYLLKYSKRHFGVKLTFFFPDFNTLKFIKTGFFRK